MYGSRFAIEFNFRDGKQYFGLEDFKNTKKTQVENSVGLAFFMTNLSLLVRRAEKALGNDVSILDIIAHFRADFYVQNILNTLQNTGGAIFILKTVWIWENCSADFQVGACSVPCADLEVGATEYKVLSRKSQIHPAHSIIRNNWTNGSK